MAIKRIPRSISLAEAVDNRLLEMKDYYGYNISTIVQIAIMEMFAGKYRKERFGYQSGTDRKEPKESMKERIAKFEAMSDEEATAHLSEIGFFSPEELEECDYAVMMGDSGRILRTTRKNGSGGYDEPFGAVVAQYKKFLLANRE